MTNFNIADLVVRLNSAARKRLVSVKVPYSRLSLSLLRIFWVNGIINGFFVTRGFILVFLKYYLSKSVFRDLKIISKPGRRIYWRLGFLRLKFSSRNFSGFFVISTAKGLVSSSDCLLGLNCSGEVILQVFL